MPDQLTKLSPNQQSMLDLALSCDLKVSDPSQHDVIRARHAAILTQNAAADYIHEVEDKIHSQRQFRPPSQTSFTRLSSADFVAQPLTTANITPIVPSHPALAALGIFGLLALMIVSGWYAPLGVNFVLITVCMFLVLIVLGISITRRALGVLINERNLMSLSRFQMAVWTVLILAAYFTFALMRISAFAHGFPKSLVVLDPLDIQIDWHLWVLLGISTTSLVGSPLILSSKTLKQPAPTVSAKTALLTDEQPQEVAANSQGLLYGNTNISDASLSDMFQGDELSNTTQIDLAKVQMFYFTVVAAVCFFVMVFEVLVAENPDLTHLPVLAPGLIAVLGISHAGYLTSKSVDHTKSQS